MRLERIILNIKAMYGRTGTSKSNPIEYKELVSMNVNLASRKAFGILVVHHQCGCLFLKPTKLKELVEKYKCYLEKETSCIIESNS